MANYHLISTDITLVIISSIVDTSNTSSLFSLSLSPISIFVYISSLLPSFLLHQLCSSSSSTAWIPVEEMLGSLDTTTIPHQQQQQQVILWQHALSFGKERSSSITDGSNKRKMGNAESSGDYYCSNVADKKIKGEGQTTSSMNKKMKNHKSGKDGGNWSECWRNNFIHVRAKRGQATDSHSLAERVRREKISERMKYLQDLVPGCDRITGKAGMLDEIINYVQSLQSQVEFLSMKLATVNPDVPDFRVNTRFMMTSGGDDTTVCRGGSELTDTSYLGVNCGSVGINSLDLQQQMLQVSDSFTNTFLGTSIPSPDGGFHDPHFQGIITGGYQNLKLET